MRMLIIDWNRKRSYGFKKYIRLQLVDGVEQIHFANPKRGYVEGYCFRNFPQLHIKQNQMLHCAFENCDEIFLTTDCGHAWCRFENIKALHCTGSFLTNCQFENIQCDSGALIELNKCRLSDCLFQNIHLLNETLLIYGEGSSYVIRSELVDVVTEREDGTLFYRKKVSFWPFVDEDTKVNVTEVNHDEHI